MSNNNLKLFYKENNKYSLNNRPLSVNRLIRSSTSRSITFKVRNKSQNNKSNQNRLSNLKRRKELGIKIRQ